MNPKILVICGPTTTGKSALAVKLAHKYNGEVVSADSRQVYRGFNIGSGKITKKEMKGVLHHLIDVADPRRQYSVVRYIVQTRKVIQDVLKRGKLPILCGGTGFYIENVLHDGAFPEVPPNLSLRKKLEKKSVSQLFSILKKIDPARAKNIDPHNPRRLIRAIEIAKALGKVPAMQKVTSPYTTLKIGIDLPDTVLKRKYYALIRANKGWDGCQIRGLRKKGLSWKRLESFGLEYKYVALFLHKKLTKQEMVKQLETAIWHYAKRQRTWFRRDTTVQWFTPAQTKKMASDVKNFIQKKTRP